MTKDSNLLPGFSRRSFLKLFGAFAAVPSIPVSPITQAAATSFKFDVAGAFMNIIGHKRYLITFADIMSGQDYCIVNHTTTLSNLDERFSLDKYFDFLEESIRRGLTLKEKDQLAIAQSFASWDNGVQKSREGNLTVEFDQYLNEALKTGDFSKLRQTYANYVNDIRTKLEKQKNQLERTADDVCVNTQSQIHIRPMLNPRYNLVTDGDKTAVVELNQSSKQRYFKQRGLSSWVVRNEQDKTALRDAMGSGGRS